MKTGPITAEIAVVFPFYSHVRVGDLSITQIGPVRIRRVGDKVRIGLR